MITASDLARISGHAARLWDFSPSHDLLVVQLTDPNGTESYLVFSGCERIELATFFTLKDPRIAIETPDRAVFHADGVHIQCQDVSLHAQYQP